MNNTYVDSNWCPECGEPRGVCQCDEEKATQELKPCPFCGEAPSLANEFVTCISEGCPLFMAAIPVNIWNYRRHNDLFDLEDEIEKKRRELDQNAETIRKKTKAETELRAARRVCEWVDRILKGPINSDVSWFEAIPLVREWLEAKERA